MISSPSIWFSLCFLLYIGIDCSTVQATKLTISRNKLDYKYLSDHRLRDEVDNPTTTPVSEPEADTVADTTTPASTTQAPTTTSTQAPTTTSTEAPTTTSTQATTTPQASTTTTQASTTTTTQASTTTTTQASTTVSPFDQVASRLIFVPISKYFTGGIDSRAEAVNDYVRYTNILKSWNPTSNIALNEKGVKFYNKFFNNTDIFKDLNGRYVIYGKLPQDFAQLHVRSWFPAKGDHVKFQQPAVFNAFSNTEKLYDNYTTNVVAHRIMKFYEESGKFDMKEVLARFVVSAYVNNRNLYSADFERFYANLQRGFEPSFQSNNDTNAALRKIASYMLASVSCDTVFADYKLQGLRNVMAQTGHFIVPADAHVIWSVIYKYSNFTYCDSELVGKSAIHPGVVLTRTFRGDVTVELIDDNGNISYVNKVRDNRQFMPIFV